MSAVRERLPEGRYGRAADAAADRRLRAVAVVCGGLVVAALALGGWWYVSGNSVSGDVIHFQVVSDSQVRAQAESTRAPARPSCAPCARRARTSPRWAAGTSSSSAPGSTVDTVVTIRTTARGTTAELLSCEPAKSG